MNYEDGKLKITIRELMEIITPGANLEESEYKDILDETIDSIKYDQISNAQINSEKNNVLFDVWPAKKYAARYIDYIKKGVIVISSSSYFDENDVEYKGIIVENALYSYIELGKRIRDFFNIPTITITG